MNNLNNIPSSGTWGDAASRLNDNFNKIKQAVTTVENASKNNKGYFTSLSALSTAFPSPKDGQTAYVYDEASSTQYYIYNAVNGAWVASSVEAPSIEVDLTEYTKTGGSTKTTKQVEDEIAQLAGDLNKNEGNPFYTSPGKYLVAGSGILGNSAISSTSKFIEISRNADITVFGRSNPLVAVLAYYTDTFTFISDLAGDQYNNVETTIPSADIPATAKYVRICCETSVGGYFKNADFYFFRDKFESESVKFSRNGLISSLTPTAIGADSEMYERLKRVMDYSLTFTKDFGFDKEKDYLFVRKMGLLDPLSPFNVSTNYPVIEIAWFDYSAGTFQDVARLKRNANYAIADTVKNTELFGTGSLTRAIIQELNSSGIIGRAMAFLSDIYYPLITSTYEITDIADVKFVIPHSAITFDYEVSARIVDTAPSIKSVESAGYKTKEKSFDLAGYYTAAAGSEGNFVVSGLLKSSIKLPLEGVLKIKLTAVHYNGDSVYPIMLFDANMAYVDKYTPETTCGDKTFEVYVSQLNANAKYFAANALTASAAKIEIISNQDVPDLLKNWLLQKEGLVYPNASDKFPNFRKHWISKDKDLVVVGTGTSLSAGTAYYCTARTDANERPPLMFNNNLSNFIWDKLRWEGQFYRRYDYPGFFAETGVFATSTQLAEWDDKVYRDGQTRYIDGEGSFSFVVPINAWQFNLIYRSDSVGSEAVTLAIAEGNNKMEVWDGAAWVEANGYVFSMREPPVSGITDLSFINPYTETVVNKATYNTKGNTTFQKRLKMRCKSAIIDSRAETKTVTVSSVAGRLMYWGVEWSVREFMITYINAARGGHNMDMTTGEDVLSLCHFQDNEVWGFKPDLILSEIPIINSGGARPGEATRPSTYWGRITENFFFDETVKISMTKRCIDLGLAVPEFVLWNTSISNLLGVDENGELKISADKDGRMLTAADCQMMCYQHIKDNHPDVFVINAIQQWIDASVKLYGSPGAATTPSNSYGYTLTIDDIHWNDLGTKVMAKVILPALDFII